MNRTITSLEQELYLRMMDWLFIRNHDIKIWSIRGNYRRHKYVTKLKSVNFFPVISLTDKIRATESKRGCAGLSKICADLFSAKDWQAFLTKIFGTETRAKPIKTQENIQLRTKLTRSSLKDRREKW